MPRSVSTIVLVAGLFAAVSPRVLYVRLRAPSARAGGPGSARPERTAATRFTEEVTASLYFSCSVKTGMLSPTTESITWSPSAFMKAPPPVSAPSLAVVTTSRTPRLAVSPLNHLPISLSPKAKASDSNSSFRSVATSSR